MYHNTRGSALKLMVVPRLQLIPDLTIGKSESVIDSVPIFSAPHCRSPESMCSQDAEECVVRLSCIGNYQSCLRENEHWPPS